MHQLIDFVVATFPYTSATRYPSGRTSITASSCHWGPSVRVVSTPWEGMYLENID